MKTTATRRALLLANVFNLLAAIYFITISIVALIQLRWYHQLTVTVKIRHILTSATSYFAFLILIFVALVLIAIFVANTLKLSQKTYLLGHEHGDEDAVKSLPLPSLPEATFGETGLDDQPPKEPEETLVKQRYEDLTAPLGPIRSTRIVIKDSTRSFDSNSSVCFSILIHLLASIGLVIILIIWLFNTGELVRDSISTQLDMAFARYQFSNRSNHYSVAIDGMQDINNCCGSLDYTDFPHQRISGLSSGHYPGSCCGKNIFGVNARVLCTPEEIWRARQTAGCTTILANYYDLVSLLVVPVALVCLFVNITIIALITISKGNSDLMEPANEEHPLSRRQMTATGSFLKRQQARRTTAATVLAMS